MNAKKILITAIAFLSLSIATHSRQLTIKLGTLAPKNSPWHFALLRMAAEWNKISDEKIRVKVYSDGVAGGEEEMLRKMRIGQLDAAAISSGNLSDIYSGVIALSLPMQYLSNQEVEAVSKRLRPLMEEQLTERNFVPIAWTNIGWLHLFSNHPVRTTSDLGQLKLALWGADAKAVRFWQKVGFANVIPLDAVEGQTALQSRMVNAYYSTKGVAAAMQWFGHTPHMNDLPFAPLFAAVLLRKRTWEKIPADLRPKLLQKSRAAGRELSEAADGFNKMALDFMISSGLEVNSYDADFLLELKGLVEEEIALWLNDGFIDPRAYQLVQEELKAYRSQEN